MAQLITLLDQAKVLSNLNRHTDAEKKLHEALALDPFNIETLTLLCACKLSLHKLNQAIEIAENIIRNDPENPDGYALMANACSLSGEPQEAESYILEALRIDGINANYLTMLSCYLLMQSEEPAAVQAAVNALKINPEYVPALAALGRAKFELEDFDEALYTFHKALQLDPNNASLLFHIGKILKETGNSSSARAMFLDSLRSDPNFNEAAIDASDMSFRENFIYRFHYYLIDLFKQSHFTRLAFFAGAFLFLILLAQTALEDFPVLSKILALAGWSFLLILLSVFIFPSVFNLAGSLQKEYKHLFSWKDKLRMYSTTTIYLISIGLMITSIFQNPHYSLQLMHGSWIVLITVLPIQALLSNYISGTGRIILLVATAAFCIAIYLVSSNKISISQIWPLYLYGFIATILGVLLYSFRKISI